MRKIIYYILFIFVLFSCTKEASKPIIVSGDAFGTTYSIKFYSEKDFDIEKGIDSIIYLINRSVSTYQENSDISKINRGDTTIVVDNIFIENFNISKDVFIRSQGYFDPTIGVLRNAYGFGDTQPIKNIDESVIDSLLLYVGFQKLTLTSDHIIHKKFPQIYIDFNAVAKGYAVDRIGDYLETNGTSNYIIELGGEILAKGMNLEQQKSWIAGIETNDSDLDNRSYSAKVSLDNIALASSGNYRKFRIDHKTGEMYVHTINPLTGKAEKSDVTSATVLAPTCAYADAYATAFMALGLEKSKEVLKKLNGIHVYLTYTTKEGQQQVFMTEGLKKYLVD